jgi:hypothetical protein
LVGQYIFFEHSPQVQLVQSNIVDVRARCLVVCAVVVAIGAEVLLLVEDVVLGGSNDTGVLNTLYGLGNTNTRENRVWREALPVTAAFWSASNYNLLDELL